jgi:hypothetical protein
MLTKTLNLITWIQAHPGVVALWVAVAIAVSFVIGAAVFAIWQAHEEQKQEQQRQRLEAAIGLTQILDREAGRVPLPPPLGARPPRPRRLPTTPKAPGYPSRRVG